MIIQELYIKNFGPIEELLVRPSGGIMGVTGANGKGKSHIASALRFLFTNNLPDAAETYIRRGEKSAELEVKFEVGGRPAVLSRKILPYKTTAEFSWEEKTYTRVAAVYALMDEIFQVSADIIGRIAFCPQGTLNDLLFSGDASREKLFADLMGVDFTKSRDILGIKINVLKNKLSNLLPIIEQEEASREELLKAIADTKTELDQLNPETLKEWEALKKKVHDLTRLRSLKQSVAHNREQAKAAMELVGSTVDKAGKYQELQKKLSTYQDHLRQWNDVLQKRRNAKGMLDQLQQLTEQLQRADLEIAELEQTLQSNKRRAGDDAPLKLEQLKALPRKLNEQLDKHREWKLADKSANEHRATVERLTPLQTTSVNALRDLATRGIELEADKKRLTRVIEMREAIAAQKIGTDMSCPQCSLKLDREALNQLSATTIKESLAMVVRNLETYSADYKKAKQEVDDLNKELNAAVSSADFHRSRADALAGFRVVDVEAVEKERDKAIEDFNKLSETCEVIRVTESKLKMLYTNRTQLRDRKESTQSFVEKEVVGDIADNLEKAETAVTQWETSIRQVEEEALPLKEAHETHKEASRKCAEYTKAIADCEMDIDAIIRSTPELANQVGAEKLKHYMQELEGFESLSSKVLNLNSLLSERTSMLERCEKKLADLRLREKEDTKLRKVIQKLENARGLLSRTGLPGMYLRERFQQIVNLTQVYLEKTGADYVVYPAEKGIGFSYSKPDSPEDGVFAMNKLSGGQRVRLSISFMLAVAQLMIPAFKFISFDEPSNHLDEMGKESVIDLFQSLQQFTNASGQQILLIDHVPEFARAFSTVIDL